MKINYKFIEHERTEDSPFIGALISSTDCKFNCENCQNDGLKKASTFHATANYIIQEVKRNPINEGIILGGLEWTLQREEMKRLIQCANDHDLFVMVYTGTESLDGLGDIIDLLKDGSYIKIGRYDEKKLVDNNIQYGVKLASSNQQIIKIIQY